MIDTHDIVFCDFGPVFAYWEADFGRTFVLGDDPGKHAIRDALPGLWERGREHFAANPDISGAELYEFVGQISRDAGYHFGGYHAGQLVGEFPHEKVDGRLIDCYIAPKSDQSMRRTDRAGRTCHWILEIHLVNPARTYGSFYEQLLDIG